MLIARTRQELDAALAALRAGAAAGDLRAGAATGDLRAGAATGNLRASAAIGDLRASAATGELRASAAIGDLRASAAIGDLRASAATVTLVPTMGALHAGHLSLVEHARRAGSAVVASIFVNPLQFGQAEDLARYPRDEAGDLEMLGRAGCDAVWMPEPGEMYPEGDVTLVDVSGPAEGWEGAARPGHFRGVATVVTKLFGQVRPDAACFGEKDWQQLQVIRRITQDLALRVRIIGVPTMRHSDGLALSSRNRFLTAEQRATAPCLHAAMQRCAAAIRAGCAVETALHDTRTQLADCGLALDYLALVTGSSLLQVAKSEAGARLIAAARLGSVRLLDNIGVD